MLIAIEFLLTKFFHFVTGNKRKDLRIYGSLISVNSHLRSGTLGTLNYVQCIAIDTIIRISHESLSAIGLECSVK